MKQQELKITFTQSEEQWLEARGTRFTASEIHKLMGSSRFTGLRPTAPLCLFPI